MALGVFDHLVQEDLHALVHGEVQVEGEIPTQKIFGDPLVEHLAEDLLLKEEVLKI